MNEWMNECDTSKMVSQRAQQEVSPVVQAVSKNEIRQISTKSSIFSQHHSKSSPGYHPFSCFWKHCSSYFKRQQLRSSLISLSDVYCRQYGALQTNKQTLTHLTSPCFFCAPESFSPVLHTVLTVEEKSSWSPRIKCSVALWMLDDEGVPVSRFAITRAGTLVKLIVIQIGIGSDDETAEGPMWRQKIGKLGSLLAKGAMYL